MATGPRLMALW